MKKRATFNPNRYRKLVWFFATIFAHVIWWDLLLRRLPVFGGMARDSATERWRKIARRFRDVAIEMGGVLIKLGQFLSIRVDVLPVEITGELMDLQDEVPPADLESVLALIHREFGRPADEVFIEFNPEPLAAASLAQTHTATLQNGQQVVVKVQRPGIDVLVETDLAAIALAIRWLKLYPRVRRRVNLDWLAEEFTAVTSRELDFVAEGHNAERFAEDFADDPAIYIPEVHWDYTTRRVLTMENVAFIRMADLAAIEAAGISRAEVAKRLYGTYMRQIFVTHFVHADPHPGNLFVRPLPRPADAADDDPTPFQIVFVDFGMVASIPKRLRNALRDFAIGVGTRDVARIIQSYIEADTLLPGADIKRLEEAHQMVFDRFWGAGMSELRDMALSDAPYLLEEYRDLIYESPFQFQVDMLFVVRAVGLLSGMATNLNPDFDPWTETIPFAETFAREELRRDWSDWKQQLAVLGRVSIELLPKVDKVLSKAERGLLSFETSFAPDARRSLGNIEHQVQRLTWAVVSVGMLVSGVVLRVNEGADALNSGFLVAAAIIFVWKVMR